MEAGKGVLGDNGDGGSFVAFCKDREMFIESFECEQKAEDNSS